MKRLWTIMRKEVRHILRDPLTLLLILALPASLLVLLGYGITGESSGVTLAIVDFDKSDSSRAYVQRFTSSDDFRLIQDLSNVKELERQIEIDKVDVGIIIPESFERELLNNGTSNVMILLDGSSNPTDSTTSQLKLTAISEMANQDILMKQVDRSGQAHQLRMPINTTVQTLYNPNGNVRLFMIPGLITIILQVQTILLAALSIVREREQGTMEQLIVTPIKSWELMLGKIIPYLIVCLLNLFLLLWMAEVMFGVHVMGNMGELIGLSVIFILGSLGMGVLISNISKTQMQAVYISVFLVIIPAVILSGMMFSRESMPAFTYWYSELLPVTQYLEITRGIIVRGVDAITLLYTSTIPLIVLSVCYFIASVFAFRKHL
ncbi:MAG TPA: ABC transporter permease [Anaerolineaceae bacterium]|nr:ABC transporter permease [Anaerolineaceae bacterium]HQC63478.1 ABC transporter permease [Anaerolineaceae bacterium]